MLFTDLSGATESKIVANGPLSSDLVMTVFTVVQSEAMLEIIAGNGHRSYLRNTLVKPAPELQSTP